MMQLRSTLDFHPEHDASRMQEFWPDCRADYLPGERPRLVLRRSSEEPLDFLELGKVTVLSGRCRNFGVDLVFLCEPAIGSQLAYHDLHRIIQIETERVAWTGNSV